MGSRLLDTLIGAALAALAIHLVLPDWRGRRLDEVLADTVRQDARYLAQIIGQYVGGRRDDLAYRIARRDAHNAAAALSGVLANMLREPGQDRRNHEALLRFLATAHTLLGHLSALGVHRQAIRSRPAAEAVMRAGSLTVAALDRLAVTLAESIRHTPHGEDTLGEALDGADVDDETARLVLGQLALVLAQRDRLGALAGELRTG